MGDFVTQSNDNPTTTFYKHIKKLLPAHLLEYDHGNLTISRYWELNTKNPLPLKSDDAYISEFKILLQQAVECRIPDDANIGVEVSGGIDCTSVASVAKNYLDKQNRNLFTYSHASVDNENYPSEKEAIERYLEFLQPYKHTFTPEKIRGMRHKNFFKACMVLCYYWLKIKMNWGSEKPLNKEMGKNRVKTLEAMKSLYPGLKEYTYQRNAVSSRFKFPNEIIKERLLQPELAQRCESTTIAASHYGVLYRYPLLDIRLLQYMISLPPHMLYQDGMNRYIFRKTIENWLPKKIAWQPKPPGNMYGWIMEAYKFDHDNHIEYSITPENEEIRFCLDFWKYRDETTYKGDKFMSIK